ncbi:PelD GGDEF domain-containing protein [Pseudoalteromonas sp. BDTF-M6]|uniref:PelD GGDEF domain-containing protein n=1 Tax=Pseudoalteromonas sp. BDTF-M6 TaxID=2796132 RepID=UPI001BAE74E5|nr:PelD GGDEF domain-containing protein [Pseudoalteromonas sp. BDTF-M6]MBS3797905.1 GAF domain-containing protein [Pseudoalteromonas sp. BDTF-M6]
MPHSKRRGINALINRLLLGSDNQPIAWFELVFITFLALSIWGYQSTLSHDRATDYFYWPMFGPVLIALRYGFGRGMMSFVLLLLGAGLFDRLLGTQIQLSFSVSVGTAVVTMLVGEFRDHWHEINQRFDLNHRYMEQKLKSFTQNYHLLKISHDQLEQRAAGKQMSLRTGIQLLQQAASGHTENRLANLAQKSLQVFADVITMYQAGLYEVRDGKLVPGALATVGSDHQLHPGDPMLADVLVSKAVLSPADFIESDEHQLHYQLVVPMVDVSGEIQGVLLAEKVKFVSLTEGNIALMALLAGYIANFMSHQLFAPILQPEQRQLFSQYLDNQLWYKRHYGVDSALVVFTDTSAKQYLDLYRVTDYRRGADVYWACENSEGKQVLCVLLPMTTAIEAQQFIERIETILNDKHNYAAGELDVVGPLLVFEQHQQVNLLLDDLGAFDEDLVDSSNDTL